MFTEAYSDHLTLIAFHFILLFLLSLSLSHSHTNLFLTTRSTCGQTQSFISFFTSLRSDSDGLLQRVIGPLDTHMLM